MRLKIDGQPVKVEKLSYRQLGFGEKIKGVEVYSLELILNITEFSQILEKPFNDFVEDNKEDDIETEGSDSIEILVNYNYPSFSELMSIDKDALSQFIQRFLFFELLENCLGDNPVDQCIYSTNAIHSIFIDKNEVIIKGEAYRLKL